MTAAIAPVTSMALSSGGIEITKTILAATDFDPPLIERVTGDQGQPVSVEGEFGDPVDAFQITAAGVALVQRTEPTA